jgi:hypothetical protein
VPYVARYAGRSLAPWPFSMIVESAMNVGSVSTAPANGYTVVDLSPSNITFGLPELGSLSPDKLTRLLGPVKTEELTLLDGSYSQYGPTQVVQAAHLAGLDPFSLTQI